MEVYHKSMFSDNTIFLFGSPVGGMLNLGRADKLLVSFVADQIAACKVGIIKYPSRPFASDVFRLVLAISVQGLIIILLAKTVN